MENKKTPEIRFAGFEDEWEYWAIRQVANRYDSLRVPITASLRISGKTPYYGANGIQDYVDGYTHNGEFILIAEDGANNLMDYPIFCVTGEIWVNNHAHVLSAKNTISDKYFLMYSLKALNIEPYIVGGSRTKLNADTLMKIEIPMPRLTEQTHIGNFFKQLDDTVSICQGELDRLKQTKQGFLQKMFPKEGESVPEIRFPRFKRDWKIMYLGELMDISSASRVHKNEWTASGVRFFRSSDVVSFYKGVENSPAYISYDLYKKLSQQSGSLQSGDVLITGGGSIGIPYLVEDNNPLYFKDADLIWLKNGSQLDGAFLYYSFIAPPIKSHIASITHIGTISHYTIEQAKSTPFCLPSKEEQVLIGNFFKQFDDIIAHKEREINLLKATKKAFLQKMFI